MGMEFPIIDFSKELGMKQISMLILVLVSLLAPITASAESPSSTPALLDIRYAECPIMGGKALPDVATIHENKVYHFCCPACIDTFRKDPAAAISKIKDAKEVALTVTNPDGKCPVCGKTSGTEFFKISGDSITFYFCKDCIGKEATNTESTAAPTADQTPTATPATADDSSSEGGACGDCSSCSGCPSAGN